MAALRPATRAHTTRAHPPAPTRQVCEEAGGEGEARVVVDELPGGPPAGHVWHAERRLVHRLLLQLEMAPGHIHSHVQLRSAVGGGAAVGRHAAAAGCWLAACGPGLVEGTRTQASEEKPAAAASPQPAACLLLRRRGERRKDR